VCGLLLFVGLAGLAQAQNCSVASLAGTHFFQLSGTAPDAAGTRIIAWAELGKLTGDGAGNYTGTGTANAGGTIVPYGIKGTYTVASNCSGTQTLNITPQGFPAYTAAETFWLAEGGTQTVSATPEAGYVLTGHSYESAAAGSSACGNGSLIGSYSFLGSGYLASAAAVNITGQVVFDGQGGLTFQVARNPTLNASGSGTYSVSSDCSGTAVLSGGGYTGDFSLAITGNGDVLVVSTTSDGSIVSGMWQPESFSLLLPQVAFGGGWYTALYFTNTTNAAVSFPVSFTADNGTPLTVPSFGGTSTQVTVPALGTTLIEMPNTGSLSEGYAAFTMPPGVSGYGVFRQSVTGKPDQEAVVPFAKANASWARFAWDETTHVTSIAIVNAGSVAASISITLWDSNGNKVGTSTLNLPTYQKTEAALRTLPGLAGMVGLSGRAEFDATSGNVAVLGLRFDGTAFTSIPATQ
jgi:hypothetical protein